MVRRVSVSHPVAGTAGYLLPHLVIDIIDIVVDRKFLAARRAAQCDRPSTDVKLDFLAANLALHSTILILATDGHR